MLTPNTLEHLLDVYPVLRALAPHDLGALARSANEVAFAPGAALFRDGDEDLPLFLLRRGHVRIARALPTGQCLTIDRIGPGTLCAVNAALVFGGGVSPVSGHADDAVCAVALPHALAHALLARCQTLRQAVFATFAARTAALFGLVDDLAIRSLDMRLAALLLARPPIVHATHQGLADELGTAREVVSRILQRFATDGLIRQSRARIEVVSRAGLDRIAGRTGVPAPTRSPTVALDRRRLVTAVTDANRMVG